MKYLGTMALLLTLSACGKSVTKTIEVQVPGPIQQVEVPGPTTTVIVEVPAPIVPGPSALELMLSDENAYRASLGQLPLSAGITCSLYDLRASATPTPPQPEPSLFPTSLPAAKATFAYFGEFNQASGANSMILPLAIRPLYTQWLALRCSGSILIEDSGYHSFSVESDDAGLLYIDNALVVSNNGHHGMQEASGAKQLHSGVHSFRLDYMQGNGPMGLIVRFNGAVLSKDLLVR